MLSSMPGILSTKKRGKNGWFRECGFSCLNSFHSVTIMQHSASFRQLMGDVAYWILFLKIFLALCIATGSYAVIFASLGGWGSRSSIRRIVSSVRC